VHLNNIFILFKSIILNETGTKYQKVINYVNVASLTRNLHKHAWKLIKLLWCEKLIKVKYYTYNYWHASASVTAV